MLEGVLKEQVGRPSDKPCPLIDFPAPPEDWPGIVYP